LWAGVDPEKAKLLFEEAINRAGPNSELAKRAQREMLALQPKP
jgi:hypothetical protein